MVTVPAGKLDAEALRQSLDAFIERHEIWRTTFPRADDGTGRPVQVVQSEGQFTWSVLDLSDRSSAEAQAEALRCVQVEAQEPFDLAGGPLVRVLLVRFSSDEHRLYLTLHRIVADWVSLTGIFLPELQALYEARMQRHAADLPQVERQYTDYAYWQRNRPDAERAEHLRFWKEYLAGAPVTLELRADHRRPEQPQLRGGVQPFELSTRLAAGLRELSRREQVPLRTTLTAALATLLYRYTGQEDLLIGTIPERGPGPLAQPMMGCFPNTVVHRADLAGEPAVRELLRRTQTASQDILPHQNVPFDAVVKELKPEHTPGRPPLVQVALAVAPAVATAPPYPSVSSSAWELTPVGLDAPAPKFDLLVEVEERAESLAGRFVFHRGLFEPETIRRMAGHWQLVLEQMVAGPERPVTELQLLTKPERAQLLEQWSAGGAVPAGPDVAELIDAQAQKDPGAVAVVCGSEQLSYGDLDARAGQLARYLQEHGVGAGVAVGVCLERSPEQVIALLAIFRAGGVYVPLDPAAPPERVRYVVRDTGMPLVLTQARLRERVDGTGTQVVCLAEAPAPKRRRHSSRPRSSRHWSAGRTSRRTSSTPRVRPVSPRASWSSAGRCRPTAGRSSSYGVWARRIGSRSSASTASTPRWSRSCPRWPPEPSWSCGAMRSGRRASCSMSSRRSR